MSTKTVLRVFLATLVVTAIGGLLNSTAANADQTGCQRCQECGHVCKLEAEQVDVEEKCFEVEEKVICIPRVVFPWQTGDSCFPFCNKKRGSCSSCDSCDGRGCNSCNTCVNNGAKTRKILVLKSSKKKVCPVCEYTWTAEEKPCATGCNTGRCGCDTAVCDCDVAPAFQGEVVPAPVQ